MRKRVSSKLLFAAKAAACAALVWFLAQQPAPAIAKALFYSLFAWACVAGLVTWIYFLVSIDDIRDVLLASLHTSSAAMWLAPAVLLLAMRSTVAEAFALFLIGNTMRLLFSRGAPRERVLAALPRQRHSRAAMFLQTAPARTFAREAFPVLSGATALQAAFATAWAGYPIAAAVLVAIGATLLTWTSVNRGAYKRLRDSSTRGSLLSIVLTLLLAAALSVGQASQDSEAATPAGFLATLSRVNRQLAHNAPPPATVSLVRPPSKIKPFTPAKNQVPGVILRPIAKPHKEIAGLSLAGRSIALAGPLTFPFTGEYHLYPSTSGGVERDSVVHRGTPLEFLYASATGGSLETEAFQPFHPAFDFAPCAKILLKISSGEVTPSSATMQLEIAGRLVEIGTGIFGLEPAASETLEFEMPAPVGSQTATAMRVVFRHDPSARDRTTKVAIHEFTLVPRRS